MKKVLLTACVLGVVTPHAIAPHVPPHVTVVPHVSPKTTTRSGATPKSSSPKSYSPKTKSHIDRNSKSRSAVSSNSKNTAKNSNKIFKSMSDRSKLNALTDTKTYTKRESADIFKKNAVPYRQTLPYYSQNIISNPWLWLFMLNNHRIQNNKTDTDYLAGYKNGVKYAKKDSKSKNKTHQDPQKNKDLTTKQKNSKEWIKGYTDGYNDVMK